MDYIFTTLLIVMGIMFHVMQSVRKLRLQFPKLGFRSVWRAFLAEEWDSVLVSFLCWLVYEIGLWVMQHNGVGFAPWFDNYGMYGLAFVWGYAGQRLAYKYLNTAEKYLERKSDQINNQ